MAVLLGLGLLPSEHYSPRYRHVLCRTITHIFVSFPNSGSDEILKSVLSPRDAAMLARSWSRNSVRLSVHLSVTHVLCDKTKQCTADI